MVAALLIYHVVISLIAGLMAWGMQQLAALLRWPTRGVWAAAVLVSLLAPILVTLSVVSEEGSLASRESALPALPAASTVPLSSGLAVPTSEPPPRFAATRWPVLRAPVSSQWNMLLSACWIASSLLTASVLFAGSWQLRRQIRHLPLQQVDGVRVRIAPDMGPAVFGWFRPQIVLPRWLLDSTAHRAAVLAHEHSHALAHDSLLSNLALAGLALAPWNPVLWWQVSRLRFAIEVDCDRRVMRAGLDVASYARTLLEVAQVNRYTALGTLALVEAASQLGARVHIMTVELSRSARVRLLVSSVGALAASAILAAQVEPPVAVPAAPAAAAVTPQQAEEKLIQDVQDILRGNGAGPAVGPLTDGSVSGGQRSLRAQVDTLREAISDPERRRVLLEEQRIIVDRYNPDLIGVLQVDEQTAERLLDLLAEQRLRDWLRGLERLSGELGGSRAPMSNDKLPASFVDPFIDERSAIRQLLGDELYARYVEYLRTIRARFDVARLTARFSEPLSFAQRQQMVALRLVEISLEREQDRLRAAASNIPPNSPPTRGLRMSPEEIREMLRAREETADRKLEQSQRMLQAATSILTPSQFATLSREEAERSAAERESIQALRRSLDEYASATGAVPPPKSQ